MSYKTADMGDTPYYLSNSDSTQKVKRLGSNGFCRNPLGMRVFDISTSSDESRCAARMTFVPSCLPSTS